MNRLIIFLCVVLLSACKGENDVYIQQIDGALMRVNGMEKRLDSVDLEKLQVMSDTIAFDVKFIQREYSDTMALELATKVDVYSRTKRSIEKFSKAYHEQVEDVNYSKKQLANLKSDLEQKVIDSSGFKIYFPQEMQAIEALDESGTNLATWYNTISKSFVKYKVPIDSVILDIKTRKGY